MKKSWNWMLLAGLLCLALWVGGCSSQETSWERLIADGLAAHQVGRYAEAEKFLLVALKEAEKFGEQDPRLAASLNNLALLYDDQGKYSQAEPLYRRALTIWEKALGPEHPNVATSLNNLALLYYNQGQYAQAEPLYQRALAIREKTLQPDHPLLAQSLENYAALLHKLSRDAEADKIEARAKAIRAKHAQENPPQ